jgi:hypothetical protein
LYPLLTKSFNESANQLAFAYLFVSFFLFLQKKRKKSCLKPVLNQPEQKDRPRLAAASLLFVKKSCL